MATIILDHRVQNIHNQLGIHVGNVLEKEPLITWVSNSFYSFEMMTRRFCDKRDEFQRQGKPIGVQVAYHYTKETKMPSIRYEGLQTHQARRGMFGRGIYVGNNPHAFRAYGDVGLVCLIIVGTQRKMYDSSESCVDACVDSFHGNKVSKLQSFANATTYYDEIVLKDGMQVLPLFQFRRELSNNAGYLWEFHTALQQFVDTMFPSGWPAYQMPVRPNITDLKFEAKLATCNNYVLGPATNAALVNLFSSQGVYPKTSYPSVVVTPIAPPKPPERLSLGSEICNPKDLKREQQNIDSFCIALPCGSKATDECPICLSSLEPSKSAVSIKKCKHSFHRECLKQAIKMSNKCPMCRIPLGAEGPIGKSPYGMLEVTLRQSKHCGGFEGIPTICLRYDIPSGIQSEEHENPGRSFSATMRKAYVPANKDGYSLVKRLRYAFRRGLTFSVGTSLSSGRSDTVVWASIHHKTDLIGGLHGWPDPAYFINVNCELDGLQVPKASCL